MEVDNIAEAGSGRGSNVGEAEVHLQARAHSQPQVVYEDGAEDAAPETHAPDGLVGGWGGGGSSDRSAAQSASGDGGSAVAALLSPPPPRSATGAASLSLSLSPLAAAATDLKSPHSSSSSDFESPGKGKGKGKGKGTKRTADAASLGSVGDSPLNLVSRLHLHYCLVLHLAASVGRDDACLKQDY
jgi:hypothetical protein